MKNKKTFGPSKKEMKRFNFLLDCELPGYMGPVCDLRKKKPTRKHVEVLSQLLTLIKADHYESGSDTFIDIDNAVSCLNQTLIDAAEAFEKLSDIEAIL